MDVRIAREYTIHTAQRENPHSISHSPKLGQVTPLPNPGPFVILTHQRKKNPGPQWVKYAQKVKNTTGNIPILFPNASFG